MKTIFLSMLAWMFICLNVQSQTAVGYSDIYGYCIVTAPVGGSVIAPTFVKPSVYSGLSNIKNNSFVVSGLTNSLLPTQFNDRPNYSKYYVEITSGNYQGYSFDVSSNTSSNVSVYDLPSYLNNQTNVSITIRPHYTLNDIVQNASGLTDYADSITSYISFQVNSFYYTSLGFLGSDYSTPLSQAIIYPGTGVILNNQQQASILFFGQVKQTKTVVPVYTGIAIVSPLYPQASKIEITSVLDPYSDSASIPSVDGTLLLTSFYSDGVSLLDGDFSPTSSPIVEAGNGAILNVASDKYWTNVPVIN